MLVYVLEVFGDNGDSWWSIHSVHADESSLRKAEKGIQAIKRVTVKPLLGKLEPRTKTDNWLDILGLKGTE
jgi:hypothetical protein